MLLAITLLKAQEGEVLVSTFLNYPDTKPHRFVDNISIVTNTQKKILADNFYIKHNSKITRFNFVGQMGKTAPGDISLIQGVHVFVFDKGLYDDRFKIPFSGTSLAHFYLDDTNPGLLKRIEDDKIIVSVDLVLAGKELVLEANNNYYWLAFAPVVATDGLPEDKIWYWHDGDGGGFDTLVWQSGDTEWVYGYVNSTAYSIEGEKVKLGIPELGAYTVVTTIFPNPSNGIFRIKTPKEIAVVLVYNLSGQLVLKSAMDIIDLSVFPEGVYFGTVIHNDGTQTYEKLIKT